MPTKLPLDEDTLNDIVPEDALFVGEPQITAAHEDNPRSWHHLIAQARTALVLEQEVARLRGLVLGGYKYLLYLLDEFGVCGCMHCDAEWCSCDFKEGCINHSLECASWRGDDPGPCDCGQGHHFQKLGTGVEWHDPDCPVPPLQKEEKP